MESALAQRALIESRPRCPECGTPMKLFLRVEKYRCNPTVEAYRCDSCNEALTQEVA